MIYEPTEWENYPSTKTSINNVRLNKIEQALVTMATVIDGLDTQATKNASMLSSIVEYRNKFFFSDLTKTSANGLTFAYIDNSSVIINGTATAVVELPIMGASSVDTKILPTGTYVNDIKLVSGTAPTLPTLVLANETWENNTVKTVITDSTIWFQAESGASFTNAVFQIVVEKSDTIHSYVSHDTPIAVDITARQDMKALMEKVGFAELKDSILYLYVDNTRNKLLQSIPIPVRLSDGESFTDTNTTYTFTYSDNVLTIKDSDGNSQYVPISVNAIDSIQVLTYDEDDDSFTLSIAIDDDTAAETSNVKIVGYDETESTYIINLFVNDSDG